MKAVIAIAQGVLIALMKLVIKLAPTLFSCIYSLALTSMAKYGMGAWLIVWRTITLENFETRLLFGLE
jgi:hypothetical protein